MQRANRGTTQGEFDARRLCDGAKGPDTVRQLMARVRPSPARLRRFADEHLLYEAGMLHELTTKLFNRHHEDDPVIFNALLESFGIHCRSLIDFLWVDPPMWKTDAVARDYVANWQAPEMSDRLANVKDRVGKEMVHLSYKRLDVPDNDKGWSIIGIGPEILGAFGTFVAMVDATVVPEDWRARAYEATGTIAPESLEAVQSWIVRPEDMRSVPTTGLPPTSA